MARTRTQDPQMRTRTMRAPQSLPICRFLSSQVGTLPPDVGFGPVTSLSDLPQAPPGMATAHSDLSPRLLTLLPDLCHLRILLGPFPSGQHPFLPVSS